MSAGTRGITLCADDYALHPLVDEAVVLLAQAGRLSATSCMSTAPRWREAAPQLLPLRGRIQLGLHFNLTEGHGGAHAAHSLGQVLTAAYTRRLPASALQDAWRAQLDAFEDAIGSAPDFIDGHQHVHQLPGVRRALLAELQRRYAGRAMPWVRSTAPAESLAAALDAWLATATRQGPVAPEITQTYTDATRDLRAAPGDVEPDPCEGFEPIRIPDDAVPGVPVGLYALDANVRVAALRAEFGGWAFSAAEPGAGGLTLLPYLDGERTPNLPEATGTLGGMTRENMTPENLALIPREANLAGPDAERDTKYAIQAERYPGFADYQRKTSRTIPVLALLPREPS